MNLKVVFYMDISNDKGKQIIRDNQSMGFHLAMKFGIMEILVAAVGLSLYKIFDIKAEYGNEISKWLGTYTTFGMIIEIILLLLGVATLVGFFMNKKLNQDY